MSKKTLSATEEKMYEAIVKNPEINTEQLAEIIGCSRTYVYDVLKCLTLKGYLKNYLKVPAKFELVD